MCSSSSTEDEGIVLVQKDQKTERKMWVHEINLKVQEYYHLFPNLLKVEFFFTTL